MGSQISSFQNGPGKESEREGGVGGGGKEEGPGYAPSGPTITLPSVRSAVPAWLHVHLCFSWDVLGPIQIQKSMYSKPVTRVAIFVLALSRLTCQRVGTAV